MSNLTSYGIYAYIHLLDLCSQHSGIQKPHALAVRVSRLPGAPIVSLDNFPFKTSQSLVLELDLEASGMCIVPSCHPSIQVQAIRSVNKSSLENDTNDMLY